jgi:hypothetical protein
MIRNDSCIGMVIQRDESNLGTQDMLLLHDHQKFPMMVNPIGEAAATVAPVSRTHLPIVREDMRFMATAIC